MATKLELTWFEKEKKEKIETRLLIENPDLSNCTNDPNTKNMIIHGDNLLALKALEKEYTEKIKCIYIDPPYNTGAAFEYYDDNLEHSIWLSLMRERLVILRKLLCEEGSIWIQIDDEEQAYLKVLCDEVFGRNNFVSMISVNMKSIAGASGGGEDKKLKKNCEYILVYAKKYDFLPVFKGVYEEEEIGDLVERYREEGISWKYTSVLVDPGEKEYIGSTVDGDGDEIKIYKRKDFVIKSINKIVKEEKISERDAYNKYAKCIFTTAMPQSSIRPRVLAKVQEIGMDSELYSIEYVPKTGRNKGKVYEQFYKGEKLRLFAWLRDVSIEIDGKLYKTSLQGTYWTMIKHLNNLSKEGSVQFPNGKKPEALLERIFEMCTEENDIVLDSFLGSGTTCATAIKLGRQFIGIEMGEHAYTHCKERMDNVISGEDKGGISKAIKWQGGGAYKFYELAPSLMEKDEYDEYVINPDYNANMLAAAVALNEGFTYSPDKEVFWKQSKGSENSYLYTTTRHITSNYLDGIEAMMSDNEYLTIVCKSHDSNLKRAYKNITLKKIPQLLLEKCEFGKENYNLNIINPPVEEYDEEEIDE